MQLQLYSFNILNPSIYITKGIFRNLVNGSFNEKNNKSEKIANIDLIRFHKYRKLQILEMVKVWLKPNNIVCLQEVPLSLLNIIINKYKISNVSYTKKPDKLLCNNVIKYKDEYRVIIIGVNLSRIKEYEIEIKDNVYTKNAICVHIQTPVGVIQCVNLHLFWKITKENLIQIGELIYKKLDHNTPYILCGDYNQKFSSLNSFFNKFSITNQNQIENQIKLNKQFTSIASPFKDITKNLNETISIYPPNVLKMRGRYIDYIVCGAFPKNTKIGPMKIINTIKNNHILYDLPRLKNFKFLNNTDDNNANLWIKENIKSKKLDISDHKPVTLIINFEKKGGKKSRKSSKKGGKKSRKSSKKGGKKSRKSSKKGGKKSRKSSKKGGKNI
jgi:endonuclease/exonuclease/phosphatase family metal-dependent hydrolase